MSRKRKGSIAQKRPRRRKVRNAAAQRRAAVLLPNATDDPEELADWVELQTLFARDHRYSLESLARVIDRSGTTDALDESDNLGEEGDRPRPRAPRRSPEVSRIVAEAAFSEIETRLRACKGHRDAYPFDVEPGLIRLRGRLGISDYEFFLLLTHQGPTGGHDGTAVLFELLCTIAAKGHLGGARNSARAFRFGSPRRPPLARLSEVITSLCTDVGEGLGCSNDKHPEARRTGDGQLDIVAFREFPDSRLGKLVLFGQCAAGASGADNKLSELDPDAFMKKWLKKPLSVTPTRMFFIPWRPPQNNWEFKVLDSGLLFDRCRIAASIEDSELAAYADRVRKANKIMLTQLRSDA